MKAMDKIASDVFCATIAWINGEKNAFKRWPVMQSAIDTAIEPPKKEPKEKKSKKGKETRA